MTAPIDPARMPDAVESYLTGESVLALSKRYGVDRGAIKRHLLLAGVELRTTSEQNRIGAARQTPEERMARADAAHTAVRGKPADEGVLVRQAESRAKRAVPQSDAERRMLTWLEERGERPGLQVAVGRYNLDFALADVAVEILGAEWHRYRRGHGTRTKALLDAGWHVLFVWDTSIYPAAPGVADYAVAFAQESRLNPSAIRQYRVIWGDGELAAEGSLEHYDLARVPPPRNGLSLSEIGRLGAAARWNRN